MPAEGDAVQERRLAVGEGLEDGVRRDHRAHRRVGRRDALGRRDDVGLVAVALGAEVVAQATPRADDLVGDEQHVVAVADLAHALEVALRRREAAAGVLDGLEDHGRHRLGPLELDALGDRLGEVLHAVAGRQAVEVRVGHVAAAGREGLERRAHRRDAGRAQRAEGGAVVGGLARDDLRPVGRARELVVLAGELERGLDGLRAAAGEEDAVEVARRQRGDARSELDRGRVGVGPVGEEAQLARLVGAGLGDVVATVADVDAEQGAERVEVLLAVVVPDVAALAAGDDRDLVVLAVAAHPGEMQPQVALGELLQVGSRRRFGRRHALVSPIRHGVDRIGQASGRNPAGQQGTADGGCPEWSSARDGTGGRGRGVRCAALYSITEGKRGGRAVRGARRRPQTCAPWGRDRASFATPLDPRASNVGPAPSGRGKTDVRPRSGARCCETRPKCAGTPRPAGWEPPVWWSSDGRDRRYSLSPR